MRDLTVDRVLEHIETAFYKQRLMSYQKVIETYWGAMENAPQILPPPLLVMCMEYADLLQTRQELVSLYFFLRSATCRSVSASTPLTIKNSSLSCHAPWA